ncbi:MAG: hypothetical protein ACOYS2_00600, partial [Patescibacteria group bacterium]
IFSYFLTAGAVVLDKFLISSRRIQHPAVYTFFVGLLSIFTLAIFFPFGFHSVNLADMAGMLFFGALYTFGLLALFFAFQKSEASRVVPVVGVITTLVSFLISTTVFGDHLDWLDFGGIFLLILGGVVISIKFEKGEALRIFSDFPLAALAGIFLGIAFSFFKPFYAEDSFINVFIWTRIGVFLGAVSLLSVPSWRKKVASAFSSFQKDKRQNAKTGIIFVANKILGGLGSIVFNLAISLGSVAVVNALVATEYAFVFLIGLVASLKFPDIFQEERSWRIISQKLGAIIMIGAGVWMVR